MRGGTYCLDSAKIDYADQRYYTANAGRFYTPDPVGRQAVDPKNPTSWNMYAYAGDDPVNSFDPRGTDPCDANSTAFYVDGTYYGSVIPAGCGYGGLAGYFPDIGTVVYSAVAAALAAAQAAAAQAAQPQCSISLETRPVGGIAGSIADHTYLYLQGPASLFGATSNLTPTETVEGGPTTAGCCGYLYGFVSNAPRGPNALPGTLPGGSGNAQISQSYAASNACNDIQAIRTAVSNYDSSGHLAVYFPIPELFGYNSNSFTFTLLNDVNLASWFGQNVPLTPGWGKLVPGLN
jgi:RHS repeat-associated protein